MDQIRIEGGIPLQGSLSVSGSKNAALPLMAACLLTEEPMTLSNVPHLADITSMIHLLSVHGTTLEMNGVCAVTGHHGRTLTFKTPHIQSVVAPYDLVRKMRASVLVLGPLLARMGEAKVSLPGGCAIGTRPVDLHLQGLEALGAEIKLEDGYIHAHAPQGLRGADFTFRMPSVGATENVLMAATLARGTTTLRNVAREPEISDLVRCLNAMGARIEGLGTDTLVIEGVARLQGTQHTVIPDRIEAGTYALAVAITDGNVFLSGITTDLLPAAVFAASGVMMTPEMEGDTPGLRVRRAPGGLKPQTLDTAPFPGFATDLQAQMMALLAVTPGTSLIREHIFENRYMHVPELMRMGAHITIQGASAVIEGVPRLQGAPVMATDLRASVSLVLAGLAAEGVTTINRIYHLDRGYEHLQEKLQACGARIERLKPIAA